MCVCECVSMLEEGGRLTGLECVVVVVVFGIRRRRIFMIYDLGKI